VAHCVFEGHDHREERLDVEAAQGTPRAGVALRGHDAQRQAARVERPDGVERAGEGAQQVIVVDVMVGAIGGKKRGAASRRTVFERGEEGTANGGHDGRPRERRAQMCAIGMVEAGHDQVKGVDQRAVEIEKHAPRA